ncbi:CvpA family protein [Salinithrix halophila]|uniref:CvpA family protein n=1 Tax=Salinithrix halophila TaxID=1485204 RepID=A0ABV8J9X8_9BACL
MGLLDWIIVLLVVGGLFQGYRKGLIKETASLISVLLGIYVAWQFSGDLAPALAKAIPLPETWTTGAVGLLPVEKVVYHSLAFLLLFLLTKIAVSIVASFLTQIANLPVLSHINGLGGAVLGVAKAFLLLMVVVNLLHLMPWQEGQKAVEESSLSQGMLNMTPDLTNSMKRGQSES